MSLMNEITQAGGNARGPRCPVAILLSQMSEDDSADLAAAVADPGYTAAQISRALRVRGHNVGQQSIARHRREICACTC